MENGRCDQLRGFSKEIEDRSESRGTSSEYKAGKMGVIGPAEVLRWYWKVLGKPEIGFVIARFSKTRYGFVVL